MDCQGPTGKNLAGISNEAVKIAQTEFDRHQPDVIVGSSRGGAVAMNINSGEARLVLLGPAGKKWGTAKTVKAGTVILHSRADDVVPFSDSEELLRNSGLSVSALIEGGSNHCLAAPAACGDSGGVRGGHSNTESLERLIPSNRVKCRRSFSST
jgi:alpha-beta hydrolase superfamily lysophospholipase